MDPAVPSSRPPIGPDSGGHPWTWRSLAGPGRGDFGLYVHADPEGLLESAVRAQGASEAPGHPGAPGGAAAELPCFGTLWPAGEALAHEVLQGPDLGGLEVLDLGCGTGVVGLAAACRGAAVTWLDRDARSLFGLEASARALGLGPPAFVAGDWATVDVGRRFVRVLAADVLYEPARAAGLAAALVRLLAPGGEAWVADPGRAPALALDTAAPCAGLLPLPPGRLAGPGQVQVTLRRYRGRS